MQNKTNYLAIASCAVVNMLLGMVWYGAFANPWMEANGLTKESVENLNPGMAYTASIVVALVSAFILNLFFRRMGVRTWMDGLQSGAALGLMALLGTGVSNLFAQNTINLTLIDGGFAFLQYALFGAVLGGWQKK